MFRWIYLLFITTTVFADVYYYQNSKRVYLTNDTTNKASSLHVKDVRYYTTPNNSVLGVKNEIVFKIKQDVNISNVVKKFQLKNLQDLGNGFYLIKDVATEQLFSLANRLYEDNATELSHPNFVQKRFKR